jgi:hypothetical protein
MSYQPYRQDAKTAFGALQVESNTSVLKQIFLYGVNTRLFETSTGGSGVPATVDDSLVKLETGTSASSFSKLTSRIRLKYHGGTGCEALFTAVFNSPVADTIQLAGVFDQDGMGFGYNGTTFGLFRRDRGLEYFTEQKDWNRDKADGNGELPVLDPSKGNVYKIVFQFLGFGALKYYIENPSTGGFVLVHIVEYANTYESTSMGIPNIPYQLYVENKSNTSNIVLRGASVALNLQGEHPRSLLPLSISHSQTVGATEINVLTIRPIDPYLGKANYERFAPIKLSYSTDGFNKAVTIKVYLGATLSAPSWTAYDTSKSYIEYDTSTSTVSGGDSILTYFVNFEESGIIELNELDLRINESFTITSLTTSGNGTLSVAIAFVEDL